MTETPEEFPWLSEHEALGEIYCVSFVRDLAPEEVLRRFGVDESTMEEVTSEELGERSVESMRDDAAGYIGAVKVGDWTLVIEPGGWKIEKGAPEKLRNPCRPVKTWSGRQDLNLRPLDPQSSALPSCATSRCPDALSGGTS